VLRAENHRPTRFFFSCHYDHRLTRNNTLRRRERTPRIVVALENNNPSSIEKISITLIDLGPVERYGPGYNSHAATI
jgi:hypothetical protein